MAGHTTTTADFTVPAIGSTVVISVGDTTWMSATTPSRIFIENAGFYEVTTIGSGVSVTVRNLGYSGNAAAAANIVSGQEVAGGTISGTQQLNSYGGASPTTTKGDILVDNGTNDPRASLVRLGVGADGRQLVADSTQATGLAWAPTIPTTVTADNTIPRFNGASGTPVPLQNSKVVITDDGAIQATGSTAAGDARGQYATDLQNLRALSTQVASGINSVVVGGENNTASAAHSSVLGGINNLASGSFSTVGGGTGNTASTTNASVGGGSANTASGTDSYIGGGANNSATAAGASVSGGQLNVASGQDAFIGGGDGNTASANRSTVLGGATNTASGVNSVVLGGEGAVANKYGQISRANGIFLAAGDAQESKLLLREDTTDATPTILYLNGSTATARATIASGSSWTFQGLVVGRRDNGDTASWRFEGGIHNNAGTTALIAAITAVLIAADAGCAATWGVAASIAVTADNANSALQVQVTGTAANNIRWVCAVRMTEVSF